MTEGTWSGTTDGGGLQLWLPPRTCHSRILFVSAQELCLTNLSEPGWLSPCSLLSGVRETHGHQGQGLTDSKQLVREGFLGINKILQAAD